MIDQLLIDGNGVAYKHAATAQKKIVAQGSFVAPGPSLPAVVPFGVLELLLKLIPQFMPRRVVVCWDTKGSWLRRQKIYPDYKKTRLERERSPEDIIFKEHYVAQLQMTQALLCVLGIDQACGPWFEADDLVAWYAYRCPPTGRAVIIASDKDARQLVTEQVNIYDPFRGRLISPLNFRQEVGVPQDRYLEYLALCGDASDGIPGIPRVGEACAKRWLAQYLTAEEMAESVTKPPMAARNLKDNLNTVKRNRLLIDLSWVKDVDTIPERPGVFQPNSAYRVCEFLQMRSVLAKWHAVTSVFGTLFAAKQGKI